ncbi:Pinin/SDK/MemA protein [Lasallia pustulata]|uniref:Pinin/SDK/MemA protein n=1 Tax=Lasallia pustulata TaxID=136370 RepID=A0A1W5D3U4_9LECA|nr:Pinin/SDK/MemA protein [Lasallia pustulata]
MAEAQAAVASEVILPEPVSQPSSPQGPVKRRQSSVSDSVNKRPRLGAEASHGRQDAETPSRRKSEQVEERKRGQRLFGALLGTLSQSSSSTAQKRRADIEKKQQAKLKLQAREYDEKKKQQLEALNVVRRQEQKKYNKQSMQIRHSNMLAASQFLQTEAEPKLYYKPWELLPGDVVKITSQIEETEAVIEREISELDSRPENGEDLTHDTDENPVAEPTEITTNAPETVGQEVKSAESSLPTTNPDTNSIISLVPENSHVSAAAPEAPKENGDDAGEVVLEAEEDTVIY